MNSAEKCRANGWKAGTILIGDEGYGSTVIEITAVGEELVLAKIISYTGESPHQWQKEQSWTLEYRDWREVPPNVPSDRLAEDKQEG